MLMIKYLEQLLHYYENGKMKELYSIENGRRDGPATFYDSTGQCN